MCRAECLYAEEWETYTPICCKRSDPSVILVKTYMSLMHIIYEPFPTRYFVNLIFI